MLDPVSASQLGPFGLALLCIAMYIVNVIQMNRVKETNDKIIEKSEDLDRKVSNLTQTSINANTKFGEILQVLVVTQANQSESIRDVIKELINVIREG